VEQLDPRDVELWDYFGRLWRLRQAHPELKSTATGPEPVAADDAGVFAYLRRGAGQATLVAINFRREPVTCRVTVSPAASGLDPAQALAPHELLRETPLTPCTAADLATGYGLTIPPRDAVVVKLTA
jgi:glycosidase